MKEMVGGCCVCSDERGWPDNPLVYCDGNGCTVAVHQACYGIVTVPTGPWYCRKCESPETKGKVRCELCPSKSGALKRADSGGWAHVVCALYIPEVRFGNVTSMEPIVLRLIPPERYNKTCYICQETGKANRASAGACMQCNKSGCKQQFHVTCAQSLGLLCEEAGNYLDNVKYCGYCQHHYSKLKKGGNVKTIPPYKPVLHDGSSDSSEPADHSPSTTPTHSKAKLGGKKTGQAVPPSGKTTPAPTKPASALDKSRKSSPSRRESVKSPLPVGTGVISSVGTAVASAPSPLPPPPPPPVALPPPSAPDSVITTADSDLKQTKKRKAIAAAAAAESAAAAPLPETPAPPTWDAPAPEQPPDTPDKAVKKAKTEGIEGSSPSMQPLPPPSPGPSSFPSPRPISSPMPGPSGVHPGPNIRSPSQHQKKCGSPASLLVSVPLPAGLPLSLLSPANPTNTQVSADSGPMNYMQHQKQAVDPSRAWPAINVNYEPQQQDLSKQNCGVVKEVARKKRGGGMPTSVVSLAGGRDFDRLRPQPLYHETIKDSPPHSPGSDKPLKPKMENKLGPSCSAPHMLGNELNPESMAAARLQEQLTAELAAHATAGASSAGHQLVPPPLINKGAGTRSSGAQSLDQLLERQWEQGSQFLMEQAQHFDIASLLSCLHQLRTENVRLEEHVGSLLQRRDHLLAVNARLAIPLTTHHLAGPGEPRACPRENGARPPPPATRPDLPDHKHQLMVREAQQKPS